VLSVSVWRATLGVDAKTVVEAVDYDEDAEAIVASVQPRRATKRRCGRCGPRAAGYDRGDGRRPVACSGPRPDPLLPRSRPGPGDLC